MIVSSLLLAALLTPTGLVPITDFGAKPDGSKCTAAFARAIGVCADAGGGRVVVPPGTWKTGPIELKKGVGLHLAASSRLLFSDAPADYALPDGGFRPLLSAEDIAHVRVSGGFGILEALVDGWRSVPATTGSGCSTLQTRRFGSSRINPELRSFWQSTLAAAFCKGIGVVRRRVTWAVIKENVSCLFARKLKYEIL